MQVLADALAASIEDLSATEDARLVVRACERETNRLSRSGGVRPATWCSSWLMAMVPWSTPASARRFRSSITHWVATAKAGPWQVRLAEPRLADSTVLGWLGKDMLASLLDCLPARAAAALGGRAPRAASAALADASRGAAPGSRSRHWPTFPPEDLRSLAEAFNDLLGVCASSAADRELVQDAAHELRTPMAVVSAQAHLLAQAGSDEARAQAASALQSALQRASHLSQQLLTLATLDKGSLAPADALDLAALIQTQLATLAPQVPARGLELSLDAPTACSHAANAPPTSPSCSTWSTTPCATSPQAATSRSACARSRWPLAARGRRWPGPVCAGAQPSLSTILAGPARRRRVRLWPGPGHRAGSLPTLGAQVELQTGLGAEAWALPCVCRCRTERVRENPNCPL